VREPGVDRGVAQRPVHVLGREQLRQATASAILTRILVVPAAAASASHNRAPSRWPGTPPQKHCGPPVSGSAARRWRREVGVVDLRGPRCRAGVAGDLDRPVRADVDDDDLLVRAVAVDAHPHRFPQQVCGTEYCPPSKATIGVLPGTTLLTPNATVCGDAGIGCSRPVPAPASPPGRGG
jgi:hypothetical protein